MPEYIHSSVRTTITDRSFVTLTAQGTTKLFAAMLAERGPENQIVEINTKEEFLFNFGEPNLEKYGQTGYNVLNWLESNGKAYVIRCLPATAKFATAELKVGLVKNATTGVTTITPRATTLGSSVIPTIADQTIADIPTTEMDMHIATFYPKGKGKWYSHRDTTIDNNNFGFQLSVISNYDKTFNFRTYELSFTARDESGVDQIIEGPFIVSFDKYAKDKSRESMFIQDVVNKYSQFFNAVVNTDNLDEILAETEIVPTGVNPLYIDPIFGTVTSGEGTLMPVS